MNKINNKIRSIERKVFDILKYLYVNGVSNQHNIMKNTVIMHVNIFYRIIDNLVECGLVRKINKKDEKKLKHKLGLKFFSITDFGKLYLERYGKIMNMLQWNE